MVVAIRVTYIRYRSNYSTNFPGKTPVNNIIAHTYELEHVQELKARAVELSLSILSYSITVLNVFWNFCLQNYQLCLRLCMFGNRLTQIDTHAVDTQSIVCFTARTVSQQSTLLAASVLLH